MIRMNSVTIKTIIKNEVVESVDTTSVSTEIIFVFILQFDECYVLCF
jgi:hypothetical protein